MPPTLEELPRIKAEDVTDWDQAMKLASRMRDHTAQLANYVDACDYDAKDALPYVWCCWHFLPDAMREISEGYTAILEASALLDMVYDEVYRDPMTAEQQAEFIEYWRYTITNLQVIVKPTERMLRDFGCVQ